MVQLLQEGTFIVAEHLKRTFVPRSTDTEFEKELWKVEERMAPTTVVKKTLRWLNSAMMDSRYYDKIIY